MDKNARIFVAGHRGMVGSALVRKLEASGYRNLVTRTHAELDLTDQAAVNRFFESEQIDVVLLAAARVGGILANSTNWRTLYCAPVAMTKSSGWSCCSISHCIST